MFKKLVVRIELCLALCQPFFRGKERNRQKDLFDGVFISPGTNVKM